MIERKPMGVENPNNDINLDASQSPNMFNEAREPSVVALSR